MNSRSEFNKIDVVLSKGLVLPIDYKKEGGSILVQ